MKILNAAALLFGMTLPACLLVSAAASAQTPKSVYNGTCVVDTFGSNGKYQATHSKNVQLNDGDKIEIFRDATAIYTIEAGTSIFNSNDMNLIIVRISDAQTGIQSSASTTEWAVGGAIAPLAQLNQHFGSSEIAEVQCWPN